MVQLPERETTVTDRRMSHETSVTTPPSRPQSQQATFRDLTSEILPAAAATVDQDLIRRHENQLRQTHRQLEQLSIAAHLFSLQLDLDQLMNEIASQASEICRAEQVKVYACLDNKLEARGFCPQSLPGEMHLPEEPVLWVSQYLQPRLVLGAESASVRSSICVPMIGTQNRVLGVIELRNKRAGGLFCEADMRVANCLGRIATSAIDRAMLFARIEEWTQSMETLLSFNATVNRQLEPNQLVRQLVANVTGFLDADGGAAGIMLVDPNPYLECNGIYYNGQWHDDYQRRWQAKEGIPGTVLETEFPYLVNDYRLHPAADQELVTRFNIGSCICVPIKNAHEQVLGFFKLHRQMGKPEFTWQEAAFLESLGNTAAVAIENARLVQALDRKNQQVKNLSEAHVRRLEEERKHIARELHDETGQVLIGLKLRLQIVSGLLNEEQSEAKNELNSLRLKVNDATARLKDLAKRLRPPTLDELGFEATLRQMLAEFRRQVDFKIELDFVDPPQLSNEVQTALYRIAQEGLTNVVKHAQAKQVRMAFASVGPWQVFTVSDDGVGFDQSETTAGLGLIGIKERVKMLGGKMAIQTRPGQGTEIEVSFKNA